MAKRGKKVHRRQEGRRASRSRWLPLIVAAAIAAVGLYQALELKWSCDDIFITLRYADNYLSGKGFVYNEGEFVEGYTHFLWLLILTLAGRVGLDMLETSLNLGLASAVGVLLIFCAISYKTTRRRVGLFVPLTAAALALHYDFAVWATSGLETMFYTFLYAAAFYLYFFTALKRDVRLAAAGVLLLLATLTRPDAALIVALANGALAVSAVARRRGVKAVARDLALLDAPFVLVYVPYVMWKLHYYGDFFPNSYYAKSAGIPFYSRGFFYLWLYFKAYFTSMLFIVGIAAVATRLVGWVRSGGEDRDSAACGTGVSALAFAVVALLVYGVLFVARVGGDFMYARFVIPMAPFMFFATEWGLVEFMGNRRRALLAVFAAIAVSVGLAERTARNHLLLAKKDDKIVTVTHKGIIDERSYYKYVSKAAIESRFARLAASKFEGLDVTVVLKGQARMGYYGRFKTCIENYGLTDRYIARLPLKERSRVGHEKEAPYEYLVERGTDFLFARKQYRREKYREVTFRMSTVVMEAELITYDRDLIKELALRFGGGMKYMDFEKVLDWYIANRLPKLTYEQLLKDYRDFKSFYFMHNNDVERESAFLASLATLKAQAERGSPPSPGNRP